MQKYQPGKPSTKKEKILMSQNMTVIFVCEHGAAKSIIAATYLNKIAKERGVNLQAFARGTDPDLGLSRHAVTGLIEDGLTPIQLTPQKLLPEELETAQTVISFNPLPDSYPNKSIIQYWENVPSVGENYSQARDVILNRINHLVNDL
jgi:arsenate reductase (thioredoxin)